MPSILRNILILLLGLAVGVLANMGINMLGSSLIPPPEGMDITNAASIKEHLHLIGPKYYIFPFLAEVFGTLIGAWLVASYTVRKKSNWTIAVAVLFMIAGVTNLVSISSPIWFTIMDVSLAYLPMAWVGYLLRRK